MEKEENHEKGPRCSWARNQMGNIDLGCHRFGLKCALNGSVHRHALWLGCDTASSAQNADKTNNQQFHHMREYHTFCRTAKVIACLIASAMVARAQFDLSPASADGLVANRLQDSTFQTDMAPTNLLDLTALYNYNFGHFHTGIDTNQQSSSLGFLFDLKNGFSGQTSLKLAYADLQEGSKMQGIGRNITINEQAAVEMLQFWRSQIYNPRSNVCNLLIGGTFGYGYTDTTWDTPSGVFAATHAESWTYGAFASLSWRFRDSPQRHELNIENVSAYLTGDAVLTVTPGYQDLQKGTVGVPNVGTTNADMGVFNLNTRIDYKLSHDWAVAGWSTWLHTLNSKAPPRQSPFFTDWAQFGAQATYKISKSWKANISYSYDAFNSQYYTHLVGLTLDCGF